MAGEKLYYLAKVTDREWAQSLLSGEVFLRAIECFSNLSSRAEDANNSFRGDTLEGVCYSFGNPQNTVLSAADTSGGGLIDALTLRKKIFCMYSFEYDMDEQQFVIPDKRLLAFGDTVVLILDTQEFLRRICNAVLNRFKDNFWLGYSRVDYAVDLDVRTVYNEYKKTQDMNGKMSFA